MAESKEMSPVKRALSAVKELKQRLSDIKGAPIAIVGAGVRLPGAVSNLKEYWSFLENGEQSCTDVPGDRFDVDAYYDTAGGVGTMVTRKGGFVSDVSGFDAGYFNISPREALEMDPAQRLLLMVAVEAIESANMAPSELESSRTGVYVGLGLSDYGRRHFLSSDPTTLTAYSGTGTFLSVAAGRISYALGLTGPALTVDTACSSSLVSIHLAVASLRRGETDLALAGGANIITSPEPTIYFSQLQALASDGRCKTFDKGADGYARGEGAGVVLLKRLSDAISDGDPIIAVIHGTAVNQDGKSNGLTAPSGRAQQQVIRQALSNAKIDAAAVDLIEAHGTGTPLGDPIEVDALRAVFGEGEQPLFLASVKTNFGHLETAAGVAGLLKLALQLKHQEVVEHKNFTELNPRVRLQGSRLQIPTQTIKHPLRYGGVSSFGLSGTNAHLILGPPPKPSYPGDLAESRSVEVVSLTAKSEHGLRLAAENWLSLDGQNISKTAHLSWCCRTTHSYRMVIAARSSEQLKERLQTYINDGESQGLAVYKGKRQGKLAFVFTGQGSQSIEMAKALIESHPGVHEVISRVAEVVDPLLPRPLMEVWNAEDGAIHQTLYTQPALFALGLAQATLLKQLGVTPDVVAGHSIGEFAAAVVAGALSLEDGAKLVVARAKLMWSLPSGGVMAAVFADEDTVRMALSSQPNVDIAAINGPREIVISGDEVGVDTALAVLESDGVRVRRLQVSHAFHSPLMKPILDAFEAEAQRVSWQESELLLLSDFDGEPVGDRATTGSYWSQHIRRTVRFTDVIAGLEAAGVTTCVELGPLDILTQMIHRASDTLQCVPMLRRKMHDLDALALCLGSLQANNVDVDWITWRGVQGRDGGIPTTAWDLSRYWLPRVSVSKSAVLCRHFVWEESGQPERRGLDFSVLGDAELGALFEGADSKNVVLAARGPLSERVVALQQALAQQPKELVVLTYGAATDSNEAAIAGAVYAAAVEHTDVELRHIDVVDGSAQEICSSILANDGPRVVVNKQRRQIPRLVEHTEAVASTVGWSKEVPVIITGGRGSLGQKIAKHLLDQGVERVLCASRSDGEAEFGEVLTFNPNSVEAWKKVVADLGTVSFVHAAGTNPDGLLTAATPEDFVVAYDAKVGVAEAFLRAVGPENVERVVFLSSASGWLGVFGQAAYGAANAGLDAVARAARKEGYPVCSVAFGPWKDSAMVNNTPEAVVRRWKHEGITPMATSQALTVLDGVRTASTLAASFDWSLFAKSRKHPEIFGGVAAEPVSNQLLFALQGAPAEARLAMLTDSVRQVVSTVLGRPADEPVGLEEGFFDAGLDSLMAVELRNRLSQALSLELDSTIAFDYPNVRALTEHLSAQLLWDEGSTETVVHTRQSGAAVAIVGVGLSLPGNVNTLDGLWQFVQSGGDAITTVPADRFDTAAYDGLLTSVYGGFLSNITDFEPQLFGISPREANTLDPQQRLLLEVAWHALEDAGVAPDSLAGAPVGVYVGIAASEYGDRFDPRDVEVDTYAGTGNESSFAAGRVAYTFGLNGPALSVNTACSSSLVSVSLAVEALREGRITMALAGGVNIICGPQTTLWMSRLQALAPDGRCKAFDERADGYVRSEGAGLLVLKRLDDAIEDGDNILAVIRGVATNHDGASAGLTVPNGTAQRMVIQAALEDAGVAPERVSLVQCHGTGTKLGDPIEVGALGAVFAKDRPASNPVYLKSVKTNFGHLEAAAGVAGLLETIACLQNKQIAAHLHLQTPNPALPLQRYPAISLVRQTQPWVSDGPRIAGVSSFGISGTNAHLILEEAPVKPEQEAAEGPFLVSLSGRTEEQVRRLAEVYEHTNTPLATLSLMSLSARAKLAYSATVVGENLEEVRAQLQAVSEGLTAVEARREAPKLVFLCTGAGPQEHGMARGLYEANEVFREAFDEAVAAASAHLQRPLHEVIFSTDSSDEDLHSLAYTQPAMFAVCWASFALWRSVGVTPSAITGHSTGQYVAATLAGVFSLKDGMKLMCQRAKLMSDQPPIGTMLAVFASEEVVVGALKGVENVDIAAINGPEEVVLSGLSEAVLSVADALEASGIEVRRLKISHAAHSYLMEPCLQPMAELFKTVEVSAPVIPLVENVYGGFADERFLTAEYWQQHMRQAVRFSDSIHTLANAGYSVFLELGNHPVLSGAGGRTLHTQENTRFIATMRRKRGDVAQVLQATGELRDLGVPVDLSWVKARLQGHNGSVVGLPFVRTRHWIEDTRTPKAVETQWLYEEHFVAIRPNLDPFGSRGDKPIIILSDEQGVGKKLAKNLHCPTVVVTHQGGLPALCEALSTNDQASAVVNLWALSATTLEDMLPCLQGTRKVLQESDLPLYLVTNGALSVQGASQFPLQAAVHGLGNVAAVELPHRTVVRVDLAADDPSALDVELALTMGLEEDCLAFRDGQVFVRRLRKLEFSSEQKVRGRWWITGGLGAIGLQLCEELLGAGAEQVVLTSRRGPSEEAKANIERLNKDGLKVIVALGDVTDSDAVQDIVRSFSPELALRGVVHAAGIVDDASLLKMTPQQLVAPLAVKVQGALNLVAATQGCELDAMVFFSSAAGYIGSAGQANYAAANRVLDSLAGSLREQGVAAQSLAWGPWADAGLAVEAKRAWAASGAPPMNAKLAIKQFFKLLSGPTTAAIVDLNWSLWPNSLSRIPSLVGPLVVHEAAPTEVVEGLPLFAEVTAAPEDSRREVLFRGVSKVVCSVLGAAEGSLEPQVGFFDIGLDSLMAVEVSSRLKRVFDKSISATVAFDHANLNDLTGHLLSLVQDEVAPAVIKTVVYEGRTEEPIAIVGVACRMPGGANTPDEFFQLLMDRVDPMEDVPSTRWDLNAVYDEIPGTAGKMYVRQAGFVDWDTVEGFDAGFFAISPREAAETDPQQRMLLEVAWEALENGGQVDLHRSKTGVFIGVGDSGYLQRFQQPGEILFQGTYAGPGNLAAFVSGRVAYALGLHGPNLALNTACSSSLVALHLAVSSLRAGECERALAGGVHLMLSPENFIVVSQLKALSADGRCKTFDAAADGYARAEGCGVMVLKRLSVAQAAGDPILAVIRGSAVGHDGPSSGLTVPFGPAQEQVITDALINGQVDPADVRFVETHGTGTVLGDPIEVHALEHVYGVRTEETPLYLGAVKSNIGHMEVAAGMAGAIKLALSIHNKMVPPNLHFHEANPDLDLQAYGYVVPVKGTVWDDDERLGAVSAFGLAGTNAHIVMGAAPNVPQIVGDDLPEVVLPLSARSSAALKELAQRWIARLDGEDSLTDLAFNAATTRVAHSDRAAVVASTSDEAKQALREFIDGNSKSVAVGRATRAPKVAMLFAGQGAQYVGMGKELYEQEPVFAAVIDEVASALNGVLPHELLEVMWTNKELLVDTQYTQPALFALEVGCAALWESWGVVPDVVMGHSIGQWSAAAVAGVISVADGARLVAERGRLMSSLPRNGAMAAVFDDVAVVTPLLSEHLCVAARNNPGETTISGSKEAVEAAVKSLTEHGVECRTLRVSHAFHSYLMEPMVEAFTEAVSKVSLSAPKIPVMCNLTGGVAKHTDLTSPEYWARLVREPVAFEPGLRSLYEQGVGAFIECGPHTSTLGMGRRTLDDRGLAWIGTMRRKENSAHMARLGLAHAFTSGVDVNWRALFGGSPRPRLMLPNMPWQRQRIWMDKPEFPAMQRAGHSWLVKVEHVEVTRPSVQIGGKVAVVGESVYRQDLEQALTSGGCELVEVSDAELVVAVHGWSEVEFEGTGQAVAQVLELAQKLADRPARLRLITKDVLGRNPLMGSLFGLARVLEIEAPALHTRIIDVGSAPVSELVGELFCDDEPEIWLTDEGRVAPRLTKATAQPAVPVSATGTYLVTGGLSGLGLEVVKGLVANGATRVVATSRSEPKEHTKQAIAALEEAGATIVVARGDVSVEGDIQRVVGIANEGGTLVGVIHAAGVLADAALSNQNAQGVQKVFAPKVAGSYYLHKATEKLDLEVFVLFSGGAAMLGSAGQANYSAANAYLDALAHYRQQRGLAAVSIAWGAWADVGMAASLGDAHRLRQQKEGIRQIPLDVGVDLLFQIWSSGPHLGVLPVDWQLFVDTVFAGQAPALLSELTQSRTVVAATAVASGGAGEIRDRLSKLTIDQYNGELERIVVEAVQEVLQMNGDIDVQQPLIEVGLDSLMAIELKNAIHDRGVDLPVARVMTGPPVVQIAQMIRTLLDDEGFAGGSGPTTVVASASGDQDLVNPIATFIAGFLLCLFLLPTLYIVTLMVSGPAAPENKRPEMVQPVEEPEVPIQAEPKKAEPKPPRQKKGKKKGKSKRRKAH